MAKQKKIWGGACNGRQNHKFEYFVIEFVAIMNFMRILIERFFDAKRNSGLRIQENSRKEQVEAKFGFLSVFLSWWLRMLTVYLFPMNVRNVFFCLSLAVADGGIVSRNLQNSPIQKDCLI